MPITTLMITAFFLFLFVGALFNPMVGILNYLSIYLIFNQNIWYCKLLAPYLHRPSFIAFIFLCVGCSLNVKKLDWSISRREIEFYLFLATTWIVSIIFGLGMHEESWKFLQKISKVFVFVFIFLRVVHTLERYQILVWAFIIVALFLAFQAHMIGQFHEGRLENIGGIDFLEANAFASFLAFGISLLAFKIFSAPLWRKILYVIGIAVMINAIIFTKSRGAFVGIVLACPFVLFQTPKIYRKKIALYLILGAVLFFTLADKSFLSRMGTIQDQTEMAFDEGNGVQEKRRENRIDYWIASLRIFKDHPFGRGVMNFKYTLPKYDPRYPDADPHNTFVLCYSEIGIIGISFFLIIIIEAFRQLKRIRKMAKKTPKEQEITLQAISISAALLIYLLGNMMFHSYLYHEIIWILFALPICLENATRKLLNTSNTLPDGKQDLTNSPQRHKERRERTFYQNS